MRLRDKLARLGSPAVPQARPGQALSPVALRASDAALDRAPAQNTDQNTDQNTGQDADPDRISQLRSLIGEVVERDRRRRARESAPLAPRVLPVGELVQGPAGPFHRIQRFLPPDHCHGRVAVGGALSIAPELLAKLALEPALAGVDLSRMLILDTETTGLSGGTGTVPFLIGLAWFESGALRLEQLFLPNFGGEAPMLLRLAERLAEASCLVTYNGKSFDWPLLRSRFVLNRVRACEPPLHVDLLHCVRRVLKPRMETVRLTEVERELLSFYREDDIDGWLIPGVYLSYLHGGDAQPLLSVLEHNDNDLVALAAIVAELCRRFERVIERDDPRDHLAYARLAFRARDGERAQSFAQAVIDGGGGHELERDALTLSARLAQRRGDAAAAASAWQRVLALSRDEASAAQAHFALAKLYEHRLRDFASARAHARFTASVEGELAQGRRLGRLHRRLLSQ